MSDFLSNLDKWVLEAAQDAVKQAADEPSSHPSAKADDGNQPAATGARAAEQEKDVKSQVPGQTVNEAKGSDASGPGRGENSPVLNTVVKSKATGEDSAVETASAKGKPEDPGTSHPAKADMGEKFSMAQLKGIGDDILADVAVASAVQSKSAEETPAEEKKETPKVEKAEEKAEAKAEAKVENKDAEEAGKEAAAAVIKQLNQPVVSAEEIVNSVIKQASIDADNVADFLAGYLTKKSMDVNDTGDTVMDATSEGAPVAGPAGEPAGATPGEDEMEQIVQALLEAGVSPEELMALIQGQGGAEAGAPEAAAAPAGAEMAAVAPEAAPVAGGM